MRNGYQAIQTRFHGPTNHRAGRVKATAEAGSLTLPWNDCLDVGDNHAAAARALAEKFGWRGHWFGGGMPGHDGYVFVQSYSGEPDFITGIPQHCPPDYSKAVDKT